MKKTLILDLGNVLIHVDFKRFHDKLKSVLSFSYEESMKKIEPLMAEFNKGVIGPENFYKQCSRVLKLNIDYVFFTKVWTDIFTANTELLNFLAGLDKKNLQIILASNTDVLHYEFIKKKFRLKFLDGEFLSYKEAVSKPDHRYFTQLITKYGVDLHNCIFFDDLPNNVNSAAECNISAHQHKDNNTTMSIIREFLA